LTALIKLDRHVHCTALGKDEISDIEMYDGKEETLVRQV
jgi:hypothetical protein